MSGCVPSFFIPNRSLDFHSYFVLLSGFIEDVAGYIEKKQDAR